MERLPEKLRGAALWSWISGSAKEVGSGYVMIDFAPTMTAADAQLAVHAMRAQHTVSRDGSYVIEGMLEKGAAIMQRKAQERELRRLNLCRGPTR